MDDLPPDWKDLTSYHTTEHFFHDYCVKVGALAMYVPSVIVPEEFNVVVDPNHALFHEVQIIYVQSIEWDRRLSMPG